MIIPVHGANRIIAKCFGFACGGFENHAETGIQVRGIFLNAHYLVTRDINVACIADLLHVTLRIMIEHFVKQGKGQFG
jgi:hypothetical protein